MNTLSAYSLLDEIESLLISFSKPAIRSNLVYEIWADDIDQQFLEALSKLGLLSRLDAELHHFISLCIKGQLRQAYNQLCKTRASRSRTCRTYKSSDVVLFINNSQNLLQTLRRKIEQVNCNAA
jgi:hypothetical protein